MDWSHTTLGQYDIGADALTIDLARNFLDPVQAELSHIHEVTHATLSRTTDMGLATKPIYARIKQFSHLDESGRNRMIKALYDAQVLPQEGFASLMEILHLANKIGKKKALEYAKNNMPADYYERFNQLSYSLDMSHRYRESFTKGISWLAMENGFREIAPSQDLLRSPEKLEKYFADPDNSPTMRLQKINDVLRGKPWMVTRPLEEIAEAAGITLHMPASKDTIAAYMNYVAELSGLDPDYTAEMVGDSPGDKAIMSAFEDTMVTNINHDFAETAEFLTSKVDIEWEAQSADCVMVVEWQRYGDHEQTIEAASGMKPEVAFAFFRRSGEKYVGFVSKDVAIELLEGTLRDKTLFTRHEMVNMATGEFTLSKVKMPDLVYHDHPKVLHEQIGQVGNNIQGSRHLNMGATKDHLYRIFAVQVNGHHPLHIANIVGGNRVADILQLLGSTGDKMDHQTIRDEYHEPINDYFGLMGLPWQVDWVETMLAGDDTIHYR